VAWPKASSALRAWRAWRARLHVRGHARQHLARADGLGHVVHAAGLEGGHHVLGLGQAGHEDDRDVRGGRVGLQPARHLEAVHAGHHGVEQHDVGVGLRGALQRASPSVATSTV
jgi:hypothetical protein